MKTADLMNAVEVVVGGQWNMSSNYIVQSVTMVKKNIKYLPKNRTCEKIPDTSGECRKDEDCGPNERCEITIVGIAWREWGIKYVSLQIIN